MKKVQDLKHIGIIMDGNRRWAREKGLPTLLGHSMGIKKLREVIKWCAERKIKFLSVFAFSTENWNRSKKEVNYLMKLIKRFIAQNLKEANKEGVRIRVSGRIEGLPSSLIKKIREAETFTKNNKKITLNVLLNYGGRAEIVDAFKRMIKERVSEKDVNEQKISQFSYSPDIPDLDLVIRTSGEQRTSGFMTWQSIYSELYFCKSYWPDFSKADLDQILTNFVSRQRRFGR